MTCALFIAFMTLVLPSNIDSEEMESRYFIPYQIRWIRDDHQLRLGEKSFRIGFTFCDGFKNVRKRLRFAKRDYLFASKDYASALEYMQICQQFCEAYNVARNIISKGEMEEEIPQHDRDGKRTAFTETIKVAYIKFDNGSHIRAFSSSPNAMLVFGGDVGLDEFPRHSRDQELYDVAQARITWGYDLAMWGSHKGNTSLFWQKAQLARKGLGGWSHHLITIEDAVREGLVEKINQTRGTNFTREGFLADCRNRAGSEATYQEAYMCNPQGSVSPMNPWWQIDQCQADYDIERVDLEAAQIEELFGRPSSDRAAMAVRSERIGAFIAASFPKLLAARKRHQLGYDVAASGEGDLACLYIDSIDQQVPWLRGLLTWRTEDWSFHDAVTQYFMRRLTSVKGAGDETGLGRQTCWQLATDFPQQFTPVNFSSEKHDMFASTMTRIAGAEKRFPRNQDDVAQDFFAFQKILVNKKWTFVAGKNPLNPNSHGDIATAGTLADRAGRDGGYVGASEDIQAWGKPRAAGSNGENQEGLEG